MKKTLSFIKKRKTLIVLLCILTFGFSLRAYNIQWDSNYLFHPDERAIVLFTIPLTLPKSLSSFLSIESPLNPHFFAYGNFPLYLLKFFAVIASFQYPQYLQYGNIQIIGRYISILTDTLSILLTFLIARKIFSPKIGLFAAFFYSVSVLPIQLSHFYAVDTLLSFFMLATFYALLSSLYQRKLKTTLTAGIFLGLSLATKISSLPLLATLFFSLFLSSIFLHNFRWKKILPFIANACVVILAMVFVFVVFQPYALIDGQEFIKQTIQQSQMAKSAFTFPYTLQYVGKIKYLYELKNIFLWGIGPIITTLSFLGIFSLVISFFKNKFNTKNKGQALMLFHFFLYFAIVGSFAVGWMRYSLPLYPFFAIFAAYFLVSYGQPLLKKPLLILFCLLVLIWPISFMSIYQKENTRISASQWIHSNIPPGSKLAIEHWDDALPIFGGENYTQLILPLYEPDTQVKWDGIHAQLKESDYIIIASNRLYTPLQKLTNCKALPQEYCYPLTNAYYNKLFAGKLGFRKVAEFTNPPTIPLLNITIDDQKADESFTVYDHPKIQIFKKI